MPTTSFPSDVHAVTRADLPQALADARYDAVLVVGPAKLSRASLPGALGEAIARAEATDATLGGPKHHCVVHPAAGLPGNRLVIATTDATDTWEVDVRLFALAAHTAMTRAIGAGARRPLLVVAAPNDPRFSRAEEVAALGALGATWKQLEARLTNRGPSNVEAVGVVLADASALARVVDLERARSVARDIGGTDPETMSPANMAAYCVEQFAGSAVRVEVIDDVARIENEYPLVGAVARASLPVKRHHPRIIRLVYEGDGEITRSYFFAGKGLVYDTGGADLKTDGHMAGMSRDKGGAAAVAGLFQVLAARKPKGVRVVGILGAVRNSIGSDSFVSDEIIKSRAGVFVRIGNTDAEGRLVLADVLAKLREEAETSPKPALFCIATLTGHAAVAVGPYTAVVENGAARKAGIGDALERAGDALGDGLERSRLRPEDYAFVAGKSAAEDVLSCNNLPSSRTPRGHQFPAAFIDIVSGLRAHNAKAAQPIPFVHLDVAGSALMNGGWQTGTPTGAPILALAGGLELL